MKYMETECFNKIVCALQGTLLEKNSKATVEEHCKLVGKKKDNLEMEDAGLLIMTLMSNISGLVTEEEWEKVDNNLKRILAESEQECAAPIKGKVKGIILNTSLDYIALKRGKKTAEEIRTSMRIKSNFREESWYPLDFFHELLTKTEDLMGTLNAPRAYSMGEYIASHDRFSRGDYWFGKRNNSMKKAVENLQELFILNDFSVESPGNLCVECAFKSIPDGQVKHFIEGLCAGIMKLRNMGQSEIQIRSNGQDGTRIIFKIAEAEQ